MKKKNSLSNNNYLFGWVFFHMAVAAALLILHSCGVQFKINTNLFDILPKTNNSRLVSKADNVMNSKTSRMFYVLLGAQEFDQAKQAGETLYSKIKDSECFDEVYWTVNSNDFEQILGFTGNYKFNLLSEKTIESAESKEGLKIYAEDAVTEYYNPFSMSSKDDVVSDPFLMNRDGLKEIFDKLGNSGTNMEIEEEVMTCEYDSKHYVMLRGKMSEKGAAINNANSAVKLIYSIEDEIKSSDQEIDFIYSGVPFHSYESSSSAQKEITVISIVSIALIVILCLIVFRSLIPVCFSVCAIGLSAAFAFSSVMVVFKEIHVLTFVFGTTLIGTCLDYSVHYFTRWKADTNLTTGSEIRRELFKGLSLSLLSTEICYVLLMFAPFTLLKQVALFCFAGILSTYLSVICVFPLLPVPKKNRKIYMPRFGQFKLSPDNRKWLSRIITYGLFAVCIIFMKNIRIENDLKSFYSMKGKLLESEVAANKILNFGSSGCYFIVKGKTRQDVMNQEYAFTQSLDKLIAEGNLEDYNACTKYIPSPEKQNQSILAAQKFVPLLDDQYRELGITENVSDYKNQFVEQLKKAQILYPDSSDIPSSFKQAMNALWIGQVEDEYYSVIMPRYVKNPEELRKLADSNDSVFFMNKMADVGESLNKLTKLMLILLLVAVVVMRIVLSRFYDAARTRKIIVIPLVVIWTCAAALAVGNIPLGFFSVTGIVLAFGLGIDYIIYCVERPDELNSTAIIISFVSSVISFGALAFSSFMPVHMFGVAVTAGLIMAVVKALLSQNDKDGGNVD
ncbi:MAG: MMPL family transporter [Treponema sp.]|nr:MMPL family transporter [Treponema sp.]